MVDKVKKVMHEFKHGTLHSGSKHGPKVTSHSQALAIAMSEQRKADAGGYADGGPVDMAFSGARDIASRTIEMTARAAGTEGGRNLNRVDRMLRRPEPEKPRLARAREPERKEPGGGLDMKTEDAERRSYNDGGLVTDQRPNHRRPLIEMNKSNYAGGGYVADPRMRDGGLIQHRDMHNGQYRDGGSVHHSRPDHGPKTLSAGAVARFAANCRGH